MSTKVDCSKWYNKYILVAWFPKYFVCKQSTSTPNPSTGCDCDVTKWVCPLQSHGTEAEVDQWLFNGGAPECGLSPDVRFQLMRPSGQAWAYGPFADAGLLEFRNGGAEMRLKCGPFEGQWYHFVGSSDHESWDTIEPHKVGEWISTASTTGPKFVYYKPIEKI